VAEHVAGEVVDAGATASAADDFIDAGERERLTAARALEDEEHTRCRCIRGPFVVEVVGQCSEEGRSHRHGAVMAAFAFGDGDLAVRERDVGPGEVRGLRCGVGRRGASRASWRDLGEFAVRPRRHLPPTSRGCVAGSAACGSVGRFWLWGGWLRARTLKPGRDGVGPDQVAGTEVAVETG